MPHSSAHLATRKQTHTGKKRKWLDLKPQSKWIERYIIILKDAREQGLVCFYHCSVWQQGGGVQVSITDRWQQRVAKGKWEQCKEMQRTLEAAVISSVGCSMDTF